MSDTAMPPESPPISIEPAHPARVASVGHTITLIAILLAIAAYGVYSQRLAAGQDTSHRAPGSAIPLYSALIVAEWALLRYVMIGLRKAGTPFRDILGDRWNRRTDFARDAFLALLGWVAWSLGAGAVNRWIGGESLRGIDSLFPRSAAEIALWVILSISAGFCEEVIYRGYLQRQLGALSGSALAGVLGQAVIFGISHGYQGIRNMIFITAYGILFGLLARWRRSLKPGILLHAWTDVFGGIFQRSF